MSETASVGLVCSPGYEERALEMARDRSLVVLWCAGTWKEANALLERAMPQVVLVSETLLDVAWGALRRASASTHALLVGVVSADESRVELLQSPRGAIRALQAQPTPPRDALIAAAHLSLGRVGVKEAQKALRCEMVREALLRSKGNRHATARVLRVDRRYVLKMLEEDPDLESA